MNIMIVDDNASVRNIIKTILGPAADVVTECSDGDQALAAYAQTRPDWVLMDIKMKRMDGLDATREILDHYPEAKIIMVTQYADAQLHEKARRAGAIDSVLKENLDQLEAILRRSG